MARPWVREDPASARWEAASALAQAFAEQSSKRSFVGPAWDPYFDASCWARHTGLEAGREPWRAGREGPVAETGLAGTAADVEAIEYSGSAVAASFAEVVEVVKAVEAVVASSAVEAGLKSPPDPGDSDPVVDPEADPAADSDWLELFA